MNENKNLIFYQQAEHYTAAADISQFPHINLPEVCFAGRSNVGKSSLINSICSKRSLARTSNTPGRTQLIHFYNIKNKLFLSDLPGYGYAKAPKSKRFEWIKLMENYFKNRSNLSRVFILIDARRGIKNSDHELMDLLNVVAVNFQCVLTKCDKVNLEQRNQILNQVRKKLQTHPAAFPELLVTSAEDKVGLETLRSIIATLA